MGVAPATLVNTYGPLGNTNKTVYLGATGGPAADGSPVQHRDRAAAAAGRGWSRNPQSGTRCTAAVRAGGGGASGTGCSPTTAAAAITAAAEESSEAGM
jgi:hypothetical protein